MTVINKYRVIYNNGKEASKELKLANKKVMDSIADQLALDGERFINTAKGSKGIMSFDLWEEVQVEKTESKPKKKAVKKSE